MQSPCVGLDEAYCIFLFFSHFYKSKLLNFQKKDKMLSVGDPRARFCPENVELGRFLWHLWYNFWNGLVPWRSGLHGGILRSEMKELVTILGSPRFINMYMLYIYIHTYCIV